ncbi:hypothetical protein BpHYR1_000156 [Brachionus plicatilis]|uniref:Uncharacterized protein n=1 Tax=Brachionus plicatilis TaxID=10195 RepID=A0A3M7P5R8_BRAPC|nr:hypothetical protein BpHYR1_000156 [Brachionus plicatilis]
MSLVSASMALVNTFVQAQLVAQQLLQRIQRGSPFIALWLLNFLKNHISTTHSDMVHDQLGVIESFGRAPFVKVGHAEHSNVIAVKIVSHGFAVVGAIEERVDALVQVLFRIRMQILLDHYFFYLSKITPHGFDIINSKALTSYLLKRHQALTTCLIYISENKFLASINFFSLNCLIKLISDLNVLSSSFKFCVAFALCSFSIISAICSFQADMGPIISLCMKSLRPVSPLAFAHSCMSCIKWLKHLSSFKMYSKDSMGSP